MPKFITVTQDKTKYFINVDMIQCITKPQFIFGSGAYKYVSELKLVNGFICCEQTTDEIMEMINA